MRILLEQITSELLIEQPDEPLEKILEILERKTNSGPSITSDGVRKLPGSRSAHNPAPVAETPIEVKSQFFCWSCMLTFDMHSRK
eukprot:CAMPEP_0113725766 /NCGR_PEP_ID=MMETSP0038_2-20120614/39979_1 /TAXON_ID=2898 /ORGANISM="Cryptomonas paramecium" /LENGTH=84 /DNA_ID=CAMNT_0000656139 /DNA_START=1 /DNA_END=252 /DNA_ORIENTATION=+ /assembly_acc=CAM_ASM_000170